MKDFIAECRDMMVDGHDVARLQARLTAENPDKTLVVPGLAKPKGAEGSAVQAPKLLGPDGKTLPTDARGRLITPAPVETRQMRRYKQRQREKAVRREKTEMERLRIRVNSRFPRPKPQEEER